MWLLKAKNADTVHYIKFNHDTTVGRNFGDIVFPSDKSISRKHATICASTDKVTVEDHKSTYGTYINEGIKDGKRISPGIKIDIKAKDSIKFGMLGCEWMFQKEEYITCLSTFKEAHALAVLKSQLEELHVVVSKEWRPECTHLTMPGITLTLKVVLALVHGRPIVGPSFWAEVLRCREKGEPLPSPSHYMPPLREAHLGPQADFSVREERKHIFKEKLFIFFSRQQLNTYSGVIASAGGESCFLKERRMTNSQLCAAASIVVQYSPTRSTQDSQEASARIDTITRYMATKKCRVIPESEIGLAILYVSIEQCCNPRFNYSSVFTEKRDASPQRAAHVLAAETEEVDAETLSGSSARSAVVQETLRSLISPSSISSKDSSQLFERSLVSSMTILNKKIKASSPNLEEPPSKKKNTRNEIKTEEIPESLTPGQNTLFQFIEEVPKPSTSVTTEVLQLTIQGSKRKHSSSPCREENLFNFVAEEDDNRKSVRLNLSPLKRFDPAKVVTELNLGKSVKRKFDSSDSVDGNASSKLRSTGSSTSISASEGSRVSDKGQLPGGQWLNKKSIMETEFNIKKEDLQSSTSSETSVEHEVTLKLKELDIKPAIVEINNTLIARDIIRNTHCEIVSTSSVLDSKKNFKKFSKVKPLKLPTEIVSSKMFVVYEAKTSQELNKFLEASSDEEDRNEEVNSFLNIGKQKGVCRGRSRRL